MQIRFPLSVFAYWSRRRPPSLNSQTLYAPHPIQKGEYGGGNRVSGLTALAQQLFNKDPAENKSRAAGILRRARGLIPEQPETAAKSSSFLL